MHNMKATTAVAAAGCLGLSLAQLSSGSSILAILIGGVSGGIVGWLVAKYQMKADGLRSDATFLDWISSKQRNV